MRFSPRLRLCLVGIFTIQLCALPIISHAGVIGSEQYLDVVERRATLARVDAVLARDEIAAELGRLGVRPDDALARANALSDRELQQLAENLEALPAGGSLLGTVGIVFIVLLILEFVGVIDIFKKV